MDKMDVALKNEIEYWLQTLINEYSGDKIADKCEEILKDNNKIKDIIDKLNEDLQIWSLLHEKIEYYGGIR